MFDALLTGLGAYYATVVFLRVRDFSAAIMEKRPMNEMCGWVESTDGGYEVFTELHPHR